MLDFYFFLNKNPARYKNVAGELVLELISYLKQTLL